MAATFSRAQTLSEQRCASEALAVAEQHGFDFFLKFHQFVLVLARYEHGDPAQIAVMRQIIDTMRATAMGILRSVYLP